MRIKMMKVLGMVVIAGTVCLAGCGKAESKSAAEKTGAALNKAAKNTGEALDTAAKKTGEALNTATEKTGEAMEKTGDAVEKAGKDLQD